MRVWARLDLRSIIRVNRPSFFSCLDPCRWENWWFWLHCPTVALLAWPDVSPPPNQTCSLLTCTFIDSVTGGSAGWKWLDYNPLFFPFPIFPFLLPLMDSCSRRDRQRELWRPRDTPVRLPGGQRLPKRRCPSLRVPVWVRAHWGKDDNLPEQQPVVGQHSHLYLWVQHSVVFLSKSSFFKISQSD